MTLPLPPEHLAERVGSGGYLDEGREIRDRLERMLPVGWDWTGKRVLDFGCGSGRVARHLLGTGAELSGCDIHRESIAWLTEHLPGLRAFANDYAPPLPVADHAFDLVYATSVFTHISEHWAAWLLEVHRVLAPGGVFVSSWLGAPMYEALLEEPYVPDAVGMVTRHAHTAEDAWVFHSEWWLRAHWGRAFEVLDVWQPPGEITHAYVSLRRRDAVLDPDDLERVDGVEPRELAAARTRERWLLKENRELAAAAVPPPPPGRREALRILLRRRRRAAP